ncbi:hypothetical protein K2173_003792 [Erythroxylum novogranatense]|uniref:Uncharacterized protein n=1 Tax=Erythroxylum novogranatense TaxID=1862640 RepID=A0AAV8SJC6_9ROSI|nr:hypothetical protein K2173_003792 [Erythroxylum novogranatense]
MTGSLIIILFGLLSLAGGGCSWSSLLTRISSASTSPVVQPRVAAAEHISEKHVLHLYESTKLSYILESWWKSKD